MARYCRESEAHFSQFFDNKKIAEKPQTKYLIHLDNTYRTSGTEFDYSFKFHGGNNMPASSSTNVGPHSTPNSLDIPYMENIVSVELKGCSIPKLSGYDYCILQIDELKQNNNYYSTPGIENAFAMIYFDNSTLSDGVKKASKGYDFNSKIIYFNPVLPKLTQLNIKLYKPDGTLVENADTNNVVAQSFIF